MILVMPMILIYRETLIERLQEASTDGTAPSSNKYQHYRATLKEFGRGRRPVRRPASVRIQNKRGRGSESRNG
jgi:hypothetical protein